MPDEIREEDAESLRLPQNCHALVRSAVLQVIGIVRIAMLTGREALIKNGHSKLRLQRPVHPPLIGKSAEDISANDLMWAFFQMHPMK